MPSQEAINRNPALRRVVGRWQLVGLSVNGIVGSGIYLLPATAAGLLGPASPWAVLVAGFAVSLLVLCYAQAASYFDQPGGGYLYAKTAFGPFVGFEVGFMIWLTPVVASAALANGLALAMSALWPGAGTPVGRASVIVGALGALTVINVLSVRAGARAAVGLTIAKLVPLLLFLLFGALALDMEAFRGASWPAPAVLGEAALLLLFAFAGFENTPAGAGEFRDPRRDVPVALITTILIVTLLYAAIQTVALGTFPGLADSTTPLTDAARQIGGGRLAFVLTVGAVVSIFGSMGNMTLFGPRYLYAMAVDGFGPRALARIHQRWNTPAAAIITQAAISLALALSGTFRQLAVISVIAALVNYLATAAALIILTPRMGAREGALVLPGGRAIPLLAFALASALLASAPLAHLQAGGVALLVGAALYWFRQSPRVLQPASPTSETHAP